MRAGQTSGARLPPARSTRWHTIACAAGWSSSAALPTWGFLESTREWLGSSWTPVATTGPTARSGHAMAFDTARSRTVLVGDPPTLPPRRGSGTARAGCGTPTVWTLGTTTRSPTTPYAPGWSCSAVRDLSWLPRTRGSGTGRRGRRPRQEGPSGRSNHALAYNRGNQRTVVYGGAWAPPFPRGDTWLWNGAAWASAAAGPGSRQRHAMAYDTNRGRVVLFGGTYDNETWQYQDTWEWDGTMWTSVAAAGPESARRPPDGLRQRARADGPLRREIVHVRVPPGHVGAGLVRGAPAGNPVPGPDGIPGGRRGAHHEARRPRVRGRHVHDGSAGHGGRDALRLGEPGRLERARRLAGAGDERHSRRQDDTARAPRLAHAMGVDDGPPPSRYLLERDGLALQVRPDGSAGSAPDGATVALQYIEVRVRYAAP